MIENLVSNYVCIDIETTGFKPETAELIEIAGVKVKNDIMSEFYSILIKPEKKVPAKITQLTGITQKMVEDQVSYDIAIERFLRTFGLDEYKQNIMAHNAQFDYGFLSHYMPSGHKEIWNSHNVVCSLELARNLYPGESHKLENMKMKFGINTKSHRALNDVMCTINIYNKMKEGIKNG